MSMNPARMLLVVTLILLGVVPASAKDLITIRMAHPPLAFHELPLLVASDEGFFAAEGLNVTHSFMTGGNEAATALIAGNIDVLNSSLTQPMKLRAKGAPVKMIAGVAGVRDWGIVVDKKRHGNVNSLRELKGLRIAEPRRGSDGDQILRFVLEDAGLNPDNDVQLVQIGGFRNHLIALEKGDVDASIMAEPFFSSSVQQGETKPVFDILKGDGPDILRERIFTCLVVTDDFLAKKRDIVERLVRADKKAIEWIYKNPAAGLKVAKKYFPNVKPDVLKAVYHRLLTATKGKAYVIKITPRAIDAENKFLTKFGVLKSPLKYSDIVAAGMSKVW